VTNVQILKGNMVLKRVHKIQIRESNNCGKIPMGQPHVNQRGARDGSLCGGSWMNIISHRLRQEDTDTLWPVKLLFTNICSAVNKEHIAAVRHPQRKCRILTTTHPE
jgi:hypothetical protein